MGKSHTTYICNQICKTQPETATATKTLKRVEVIQSLIKDLNGDDKVKVTQALVLALTNKPLKGVNKAELSLAFSLIGKFLSDNFIMEGVEETMPVESSEEDSGPELIQSQDQSSSFFPTVKTPDLKEETKETICHFYKMNKCKFSSSGKKGGKCRFLHPPKCKKFMKHGPYSKHNTKGCDKKKCDQFHPKVCNQSLRDKACGRDKCTFYHLKGTINLSQERKSPSKNGAQFSQPEQGEHKDRSAPIPQFDPRENGVTENSFHKNNIIQRDSFLEELFMSVVKRLKMERSPPRPVCQCSERIPRSCPLTQGQC